MSCARPRGHSYGFEGPYRLALGLLPLLAALGILLPGIEPPARRSVPCALAVVVLFPMVALMLGAARGLASSTSWLAHLLLALIGLLLVGVPTILRRVGSRGHGA